MLHRSGLVFLAVVAGVTLYTRDPVWRVRMRFGFDDPIYFDPLIIALYAAVGAAGIAALVVGGRWRRIPRPLLFALGAFPGWYLLSSLWSVDPGETFGRSFFVATTLSAGAAGAVLLPLRQLMWALWLGLHGPLLWSAYLIARDAQGAYDWNDNASAAFESRNTLGMYAVMAIFVAVLLLADAVRRRARDRATLAGLVALGVGIVMDVWLFSLTGSATPLVGLACVVVALALVLVARRVVANSRRTRSARTTARVSTRIVRLGGITTLVVAAVGWVSRDGWVERLGRDSDLTGRSDIWDLALDWVGERPLHGWGYLAMWTAEDRSLAAQEAGALEHPVTQAHSAFIESLLGGGIVGFVAFAAAIAIVYVAVTRLAVTGRSALTLAPFALFVFVVVENLAETFIVGNHLNVALLAGTAVAAAVFHPGDTGPASEQYELECEATGVR